MEQALKLSGLAAALRHYALLAAFSESHCCWPRWNLRVDLVLGSAAPGMKSECAWPWGRRGRCGPIVVRQGASLGGDRVIFGLGGAFALTRLLGTMLFGVGVTDR